MQQVPEVVENMRKEDAKVGKLFYLKSATAKVLADMTFKAYRARRDEKITELVATCVNGVRDVLE